MASYPDMSELVRDTQLEAAMYPNSSRPKVTIHTKLCSIRSENIEIWTRVRRLGNGGNGTVWLEECVKGGNGSHRLRAVKELKTQYQNGSLYYRRELEALAKFSQAKFRKFFVQFYGWFEASDTLFIVTEYHEYGDLRNHLDKYGRLREIESQDITWQILHGLVFMHDNKFAHRDLKPANILISVKPPEGRRRIKICDLGLSRKFEGDLRSITVRGTPGFMAPELVPGIGDDVRNANPFLADIWCLGETTFKMLTGHTTFGDIWELANYWNGVTQFPSRLLEQAGVSHFAIQFVQLLMTARPSRRLNAEQASQHYWMTTEVSNIEASKAPGDSVPRLDPSVFAPRTTYMTQPSGQWSNFQNGVEPPFQMIGADSVVAHSKSQYLSLPTPMSLSSAEEESPPSVPSRPADSADFDLFYLRASRCNSSGSHLSRRETTRPPEPLEDDG